MRQIKEIQSLGQNKIIYLLAILGFTPALIFLVMFNLGKEALDQEAVIGLSLITVIMTVMLFLTTRMKTYLELNDRGISYRSSPFHNSLSSIPLNEIATVEIVPHQWFKGIGYRLSFSGDRIFVMQSGQVIKLVTRSGKRLTFGINRPEMLAKFIKEEWPNIPFHVK